MPGGHFLVSVPQNRLIPVGGAGGLDPGGAGGKVPKLNTQTVSSPSTVIPHGRLTPPPVKGEPGWGVRSLA